MIPTLISKDLSWSIEWLTTKREMNPPLCNALFYGVLIALVVRFKTFEVTPMLYTDLIALVLCFASGTMLPQG